MDEESVPWVPPLDGKLGTSGDWTSRRRAPRNPPTRRANRPGPCVLTTTAAGSLAVIPGVLEGLVGAGSREIPPTMIAALLPPRGDARLLDDVLVLDRLIRLARVQTHDDAPGI